MYPLMYLQEHYPLIPTIFDRFPEVELSNDLLESSTEQLNRFAELVEKVIVENEGQNSEYLELREVIMSIGNLSQIREVSGDGYGVDLSSQRGQRSCRYCIS